MQRHPQIRLSKRIQFLVWLLVFNSSVSAFQELHAELASEYREKLACLYKLASYVEHAGGTNQPRVRIGVLGRDPFGTTLDSMAADRKARGKSVEVTRFPVAADYTACDILFISRDVDMETLRQLTNRTKNDCLLIVGEHPQFTANGGVVNLTIKDDGKAAIQINLTAAHARGLMIDARLLRVCQIVDSGVATQ